MSNLFDANFILEMGPHEFRRSVQRLMIQNGFDAFSVDGSGDGGGDLFCEKNGERWIIQCKWKKQGTISPSVIDEIINARHKYDAHHAVIATNQKISTQALNRLNSLKVSGVQMSVWNGNDLRLFCEQSPQVLPAKSLRQYQLDAVERIETDLENTSRALLFLATGLGKTVVAGRVIANLLRRNPNARILVLAHMIDLVEQLQKALWQDISLSTRCQIVDGQNKPDNLSGLTVATDKSIVHYIDSGYVPDLMVIDECHHVGAENQYGKIISSLQITPILGVTATPWRGDGFSIEKTFGKPSFVCGIEDGLRNGYLAPVNYRLFCDNINWDVVPTLSENAYTIKQLNRKLFIPQREEKILDCLLDAWAETANPKAIIFCQSILHAELIHSMIKRFEIWANAQLLHSEMDKQTRRMALISFRGKDCPILVAVDILNEGVDVPNVNIVCFARVTHSRKVFIQQLGRGLRLAPGKDRVIVLDFAADARRIAAISKLNNDISDDADIERLSLNKSKIEFTDERAKALIDEWIADAADLETRLDESTLQFPLATS